MANNLMNRPNDFFDDWFGDSFFAPFQGRRNQASFNKLMKTDIQETDQAYTLKADLPGFDKQNLHLNYDQGVLTVSATRDDFSDHENDQGEILMQERTSGRISRSFRLPNVDTTQIKANYESGILTIELPKTAGSDQHEINID